MLLAVSGLRLLHAASVKSLTFDEPVHIASGLYYWQTGDFRVNRIHPPLPKLWATAPLALIGVPAIFTTEAGEVVDKKMARDDYWEYADTLLFENHFGHRRLTMTARSMMIIDTLLFAVIIFGYGRSLLGPGAGLFASSVFLLDPNILAHGFIVKNDLPLAGLILGACYFLHRFHKTGRPPAAFLAAGFMALACGTKLSALALAGPFFLLLGLVIFIRLSGSPVRRIALAVLGAAGLLLFADIVLNAVYGFSSLHELTKGISSLSEHRDGGHLAYLFGNISEDGWWYYFPVVLALKLPLPTLILLVTALFFLPRLYRKIGALELTILLLLPAVHLLFAAGSRVNIGVRHILVLFPFFAVLVSSLIDKQIAPRLIRGSAIALVGVLAVVSLTVHPDYLAYFNAFGGDSEKKAELLGDSNLDWGQDLPRLAAWMKTNKVQRVHLAYFGTARPSAYGIADLPLTDPDPSTLLRGPLGSDWVAISTTIYQGIYLADDLAKSYRKVKPETILGGSIRLYRLDRVLEILEPPPITKP